MPFSVFFSILFLSTLAAKGSSAKLQSEIYGEEFFSRNSSSQSAKEVLPMVLDLIKPQSICDVGCGTGTWLKAAQEITGINGSEIVGFDFEVPNKYLLIEVAQYHNVDLSQPMRYERMFDLCISLEVAEHLPESSADIFVETLTSLAPVILFSAAIPGQFGDNHVNEQWPSYWEERFKKLGFYGFDVLRQKFWNNDNVTWWYRQNMVLFVKIDKLASLGFVAPTEPLPSLTSIPE